LDAGAQPGSEQRLRRQQRDMMAGSAIDLQRPSTHQPFPNPACNLSEKHKKDTLPH
jgi:hypothetical protein